FAGDDAADDARAACDRIAGEPWLDPLRPLVRPELFEDDRAYLGAVSRDVLKGGPDPALSIPLAAGLDASPEGHGTHTQLGLPACNWVSLMNRPCPTCGMTTSFTHAADGSLASAAAAQPAGTLLAIITAALAWGGVHTLVSGVALGPLLGGLLRARVIWVALGLLLAAWVYKIATWGV
ncbi:MAG: DUF2752 domain-containing protein, partial [Planctomycetota bacterium]